MRPLLKAAITNLVDHCESVLAAHGWPSQRSQTIWSNGHTLPIPYPNLITLGRPQGELALYDEIDEFMRNRPAGSVTGINDSFSSLYLGRYGMKRLFSTRWAIREPAELAFNVPDGLEIVPVVSAEQLVKFDRANSEGFGNSVFVGTYIAPLLRDARYTIHAGFHNGRVVTGVVAFDNGESIGIYALSTLSEARNRGFGEAIVRSVLAESADLPAATNPSNLSDGLFSRLGFETYGTRTVWLTDSATS